MNFGQALAALKAGKKVSRVGWNGEGMWLYLVPANSYPAQTVSIGLRGYHFFGDTGARPK
jgi:hypothetical protein